MTREDNDFSKYLMFSDRNTDSVSNRFLLANAFEGLAQNDIECNNWILRQSDYVVTYITHSWGGAARYASKAATAKKTIINLL